MITRSRGYFTSALAMAAAFGFVLATSAPADARPGYRGGGGGGGGVYRGGGGGYRGGGAVYRGGAVRGGGYAYRGGGYRGGGWGGYGWGAPVGAAIGLGVLGAAAAAAAASSGGYCRVPVYDSWGNVVGYRNAYCN
jgi:hypothetical protein